MTHMTRSEAILTLAFTHGLMAVLMVLSIFLQVVVYPTYIAPTMRDMAPDIMHVEETVHALPVVRAVTAGKEVLAAGLAVLLIAAAVKLFRGEAAGRTLSLLYAWSALIILVLSFFFAKLVYSRYYFEVAGLDWYFSLSRYDIFSWGIPAIYPVIVLFLMNSDSFLHRHFPVLFPTAGDTHPREATS